jgi:hypothetical protein
VLFAKTVMSVVLTIAIGGCSHESENLLPRCERLRSLQVIDAGGRVLWKIEAVKPREICDIAYGQTPSQFAQLTPSAGSPRAFVLHEGLTVERVTIDGWVRTDCSAVTRRTMICAGYIAGPLR